MRTRALVIVTATTMLVTGCGGSSKTTAQPTTTAPSSAPNTPKQRAADTAIARQAVLKLTDFPLGYTSTPHDNSSSSDTPPAAERNLVACAHLPRRFLDHKSNKQPNADSPDFSKGAVGAGPATQIESSVEIDRSVKDVSEPLSYLAKPAVVQCFDPFFRAVFAQSLKSDPGVSLHNFAIRSLSVGSTGDQGAGFQGRITITGARGSLDAEFNFYFVRSGRAVAELSAIGFSAPFDQTLAQSLLEKMVGRLKAVA